ncbi:Bcr/CflA family efflux MFS transporter [Lutimaribacter sp. EGI FJ00015]|uniref:Bcr/CflA family efflux MFS transporter n=1 Tax=Lutimaribacter degradans TaxID=2945989 RepID=A0ACC5ZSQ5_9RHOB|nr:Bcr/CflA family efflux MFS transporter [Lutimaribacter sp. EGI FJ00013]MCM2561205.1 Bcr/CflA family efflux MFS transporter [Lutimaribacter sp. EGI FJ00013]MCO0611846.1 Bcr/CflA family efflux MFS transporter [Lutimaribacter sp. EGI FJ00015]MCO0635033.1 Bcr/CflA family efflux MFS transporter [Lutimaribacter sp. EGI FJ00014]
MSLPKKPSLLTLILLTSISVLSLNMFLPSLSRIATDFEADYALVSLSIGAYLAVSAGLQIVMGPLSDLYGRRPVLLAGLGIFIVASIGCMLAQDIWVFLGFRLLQSAVVCAMVISRAVVRDIAPADQAARLLGLIGTAMALAPLLGPLLGGVLDELFGWRANFAAFALMGVALFALTWSDLPETNPHLGAGFRAHFRSYPELLGVPLFWAHCGCLVFSVGGFYAFLGGAPQVAEVQFGLSPAWVGVGMGSISAGFMLGNYLTGRLSGRVSLSQIVLAGRWLALVGPACGAVVFALGYAHPLLMFGFVLFIGLGNGLTIPGVNASVMSVAPHLAGSASGLSGALTFAGGAALTAIAGVVVSTSAGAGALLLLLAVVSALALVSAQYAYRIEARLA